MDEKNAVEPDDELHIRRIPNPRTFRGVVPASHFRIRSSQSAPSSPVASTQLARYAAGHGNGHTRSVSLPTTAVSLKEFLFHDNDLPRMTVEQLDTLFDEFQTYLQKFTSATDFKTLNDDFFKFRCMATHQSQLPYETYPVDINVEYEQLLFVLQRFNVAFHDVGRISSADRQLSYQTQCRLAQCMEILYNVRTMLISYKRNQYLMDTSKPYKIGEWYDQINRGFFSFCHADVKLSTHQQLLLYVLDKAAEYKYRKQCRDFPGVGETIVLYEQIRTKEGHATHAWERSTHLAEFVNRICDYDTHFDQWVWMTQGDSLRGVQKYLEHSTDARLPLLQRQRHWFSFRNGLLNIDEIKFYEYDKHALPSTIVSTKYFDQMFEQELITKTNPNDIPIPPLEHIFQTHEIDAHAQIVILALLGRYFFPMNERDKFKVALYFLGLPGTGKSTLTTFLRQTFDEDDVGIIAPNMEKTFGLSAFMNCALAICFEVSEHFPLDNPTLQSMIDGEPTSVARKFQTPTSIYWRCYTMLLSNTIPFSWSEYGGNLTRRLVVIHFKNKPQVDITYLDDDLKQFRDRFIIKCTLAYHTMCKMWNGNAFWTEKDEHGRQLVPEYFNKTKNLLRELVNPIDSFLENSEYIQVTKNAEHILTTTDFMQPFMEYCKRHGLKSKRYQVTSYKPILERYGLKLEHNKIIGVRLTDQWKMQSQPHTSTSSLPSMEMGV